MANKKKKDNKGAIIGVCAAVVAVIVIIIAVVAATSGSRQLNEDYFVSDDTKYVFSYEIDGSAVDEESDEAQYTPLRGHVVYYYEGDAVTGIKEYYEYENADKANAAYKYFVDTIEDDSGYEVATDGKYVILSAPASQYENVTASDVKTQIEMMESFQNGTTEEESTEATEEKTEE